MKACTADDFAHYFPGIRIGQYSFIDKEFISKYEALKESLKGDLFLLMEVEIDGGFQEIAIQIDIRVSGKIFLSGFSNTFAMCG